MPARCSTSWRLRAVWLTETRPSEQARALKFYNWHFQSCPICAAWLADLRQAAARAHHPGESPYETPCPDAVSKTS